MGPGCPVLDFCFKKQNKDLLVTQEQPDDSEWMQCTCQSTLLGPNN